MSGVASRTLGGLALGLIVGAGALWFALRDVDFATVGAALRAAHPGWAAGFVVAYGLFHVAKALRFRWMLLTLDYAPSAGEALRVVVVSSAANVLLPAQLGEAIRLQWLGPDRRGRPPLSRASVLSAVLLERVLDVSAVMAFFGVSVASFHLASPALTAAGRIASLAAGGALVVAISAAVWPAFALAVVQWLVRPLPTTAAGHLVAFAENALRGLGALRRPGLALAIVVGSLAQWATMVAATACALASVGIAAPAASSAVVVAASVVALLLPAFPGYVGALQAAYVVALAPFAVSESAAVAASIVANGMMVVPLLVAGAATFRRPSSPAGASS